MVKHLFNKSAEQNGKWTEVKMNPRFTHFFNTTINRLRSCQTLYNNNQIFFCKDCPENPEKQFNETKFGKEYPCKNKRDFSSSLFEFKREQPLNCYGNKNH